MKINKLLQTRNSSSRYGSAIQYIVVHYVGAISTARNNCVYFKNNSLQASAHFFVDSAIWQSTDTALSAWHCGGGLQDGGTRMYSGNRGAQYHGVCMNKNSIGIELCCVKDENGKIVPSAEAIKSASQLIPYLMKTFNIPVSRVIRHFDVTGKYCPNGYLSAGAWSDLRKTLTGGTVGVPSTDVIDSRPQTTKLKDDGYFGYLSTLALQRWRGTHADGVISSQYVYNKSYLWAFTSINYTTAPKGSPVIVSLQKFLSSSLKADGILGPTTIKALQKYLGVPIDGYFGTATARAFQRYLNTKM